ncbi:MAG: HDIG domain-containing protein [Nitrospira sp.]|nr:HDIG domain-containing protein [Nitrospira sp.]
MPDGHWSAAILLQAVFPFIEQAFGIVTDISLLELTAVSHPLLQELARRAPGTYNHSMTVASLAEAAAEAIGANGLLTRVGAYFHDIGKMLKPEYFTFRTNHGVMQNIALMHIGASFPSLPQGRRFAEIAHAGLPSSSMSTYLQMARSTSTRRDTTLSGQCCSSGLRSTSTRWVSRPPPA